MKKENITKEQLASKAKEMMSVHNLQEIYLCSDKQGFTDKELANNHSRYLSDKTVCHFTSDSVLIFEAEKEKSVTNTHETKDDQERLQLVSHYEELFGKKPAHNIGIEKLIAQIQEKEIELNTPLAKLPLNENSDNLEQKSVENTTE